MNDEFRDRIDSSREHIRLGLERSIATRRTIEITRAIIARSVLLDINCGVCGRGMRAGENVVPHDETLAHAGCEEGLRRARPAA